MNDDTERPTILDWGPDDRTPEEKAKQEEFYKWHDKYLEKFGKNEMPCIGFGPFNDDELVEIFKECVRTNQTFYELTGVDYDVEDDEDI